MNNRPLGKQLKILWLSTFIDKFDLSIDNYRQISSTIDLSTTFSMIDFDRHVTSWFICSFRSTEIESCPACNHGLTSQMVEIYNSTRLLLDNCEIFLYRRVKLSENELLTIWLCINHVVLGRGGGGEGRSQPPRNCEIALEPWAFNCTLQPYSRLL